MHTLKEILKLSVDWLNQKKVSESRLSVELLLAHSLNCRRLDLYLDSERPLTDADLGGFRTLLKRRAKFEPVAYILGNREFYSLNFAVTPAVLIPRPETEFLVDFALEKLGPKAPAPEKAIVWADIGTGSGCIALATAKNATHPNKAYAVDVSGEAIKVACRNAESLGLSDKVQFFEGSLCAPLQKFGPFDLILSNPPYISESEKAEMEPDVKDHEPAGALFDSSEDGLGLTRRLAQEAFELLRPGGQIAVELGAGRFEAAKAIFGEIGYEPVTARRDYARIERVLIAQKPYLTG